MTDADGNFTVAGLSEGSYTVRAWRKGGGEGFSDSVATGSNGVIVTLEETGRVEGTVVTASGNAPRRFSLRLRDETTGFSRGDSFFATDGKWVLDELPPGAFFVSATSGEGSGDIEVKLEEGGQVSGVEIELQKLVSVKGTLVDLETGEPVAGVAVAMARKKGGFNFASGSENRHISDDSGKYQVDGVPVGPVSVTLFPKGMGEKASYGFTQRRIEVEDADPFEAPDIELARRRVKKSEDVGDLGYRLKESEPGVEWTERTLMVGFVRPGGPAAEAGLEVGAIIASVDGNDLTGGRMPAYYVLTAVPVGRSIKLGLAGGDSVTIKAGKKP